MFRKLDDGGRDDRGGFIVGVEDQVLAQKQ